MAIKAIYRASHDEDYQELDGSFAEYRFVVLAWKQEIRVGGLFLGMSLFEHVTQKVIGGQYSDDPLPRIPYERPISVEQGVNGSM